MGAALIPLLIASTVVSAAGQISAGNQAEEQAEFEARMRERNAKATYAEGTRASYEQYRRGKIVMSNQRAAMAASGGVTDDPAAIETLGETGRDAKYNALATMYTYSSKAQGQQYQADLRRLEGRNAKNASRWRSLSTVLQGAVNYKDATA